MFKIQKNKMLLAAGLFSMAGVANAGYTFDLTENDKLTFGGYVKVDARYVDGNVAPTDYWYGAGTALSESASNFGISVNETRFNTKYEHGDVTGFIEMDFFGTGTAGGGNEIVSNSSNTRLRHAFIQYKSVLVGQTWTTFQNTSSLAESVDFGGPLNASAFIRQGQIRYTNGGLQVSLENPHSDKGDSSQDSIPDVIAKYTFKGDWGNVSVSGLVRQLNTLGGNTESAAGFGVAGRIKTFGKDDFRFQIHGGNTGRYVGVVAARDLVGEKAEKTTSFMVAYRHFWTDDMRSTAFYGSTDADLANTKRNHVAVNLFKDITKQLSFGAEVGNYEMDELSKNSNYLQFSAKYVI